MATVQELAQDDCDGKEQEEVEYEDVEEVSEVGEMLSMVDDLCYLAGGDSTNLSKVVLRLTDLQAIYIADTLSSSDQLPEVAMEFLELLRKRLAAGEDVTDGPLVEGGEDSVDEWSRRDSVDASTVSVEEVLEGGIDVRILNGLAHLEFSRILRRLSIDNLTSCGSWKKRKIADKGVFGVPLQILLDLDRSRSQSNLSRRVPLVFEQLVDYVRQNGLGEKGIFRIAGQNSRIRDLTQKINRENQFVVDGVDESSTSEDQSWSVHDVACVLKQFIRELPTPLLTLKGECAKGAINPIRAFLRANMVTEDNEKLKCFNLLMLMLPDVNRNTFKMLLELLGDVAAMETSNCMSPLAIGTVMSQNLFLPSKTRDVELQKNENKSAVECIAFMIQHRHQLWQVPTSLVRQLNQMKEDKDRQKSAEQSLSEELLHHGE